MKIMHNTLLYFCLVAFATLPVCSDAFSAVVINEPVEMEDYKNQDISGNSIINSSYSALEIGTEGATVSNNFIQGSLLNINDGGAITLRGNNIKITDNIIIGVYGNINDGANGYTGEDKTSKHGSYGMGIFDYKKTENNVITGNTVAYARDIGIMIAEGKNHEISGNVTYANEVQI